MHQATAQLQFCHHLIASPNDEAYVAEINAKVGGRYTITARRGSKDYVAVGEYLEVNRPYRLSLTFAMPQFSPNSDRITVEYTSEMSGCAMTFTQSGTDIVDELRQLKSGETGPSEAGWRQMFDQLAQSLK